VRFGGGHQVLRDGAGKPPRTQVRTELMDLGWPASVTGLAGASGHGGDNILLKCLHQPLSVWRRAVVMINACWYVVAHQVSTLPGSIQRDCCFQAQPTKTSSYRRFRRLAHTVLRFY